MAMQTGYAKNIVAVLPTVHPANYSKSDAFEDMAVLSIDNDGMVCHCNQAAGVLLNCIPSKIVWQNISISTILPQLKNVQLMQAEHINPNLRFLSRIGHHFEVMALDGRRFDSKLYFNHVEDFDRHCLRLIIKPVSLVDERMQ